MAPGVGGEGRGEWVAATVRDGGDVARAAAYKAGRGRCVGIGWSGEERNDAEANGEMENGNGNGMDGRTVEEVAAASLGATRVPCPALPCSPCRARTCPCGGGARRTVTITTRE